MSRTIRRNNKSLIRQKLGHPDSVEAYHFASFGSTGNHFVQWVEWHFRYENEMAFKRAVSRFKSDRYNRWRTAPRWWKKLNYTRPERREAKHEIYRCLVQGDFDDHQDPRYRGANAAWHWEVT